MMVLPIPKTTLDRVTSLIADFLWSGHGDHRQHWIAWNRLCTPRMEGGLGIRDLRTSMHVLHAKLAWSYVTGSSLWARFARSRFREGKDGSRIWKMIEAILPKVRSMGEWKIGNGHTMAEDYCEKLGVSCPSHIKRSSLCHVFNNPGAFGGLCDTVPSDQRYMLRGVTFSEEADRFVWSKTSDGKFSIKSFFNATHPRRTDCSWGVALWRCWMPPKVSCLVWKVIHNALSTDDNVRRRSIPIVSKCRCCVEPDVETGSHLFFRGELAVSFWRRLSVIFDKPVIAGVCGFKRVWLHHNKKNVVDCLATAAACVGLWHLWNFCNACRHDSPKPRVWEDTIAYTAKLGSFMHGRYPNSFQARAILEIFRVRRCPSMARLSWRPPWRGFALDVALVPKGNHQVFVGLVRNFSGAFVSVFCAWFSQISFLGAFAHLCRASPLRQITRVQSSHVGINSIQLPRGAISSHDLDDRTEVLRHLEGATFARVNVSCCNAAISAAYTLQEGFFREVRDLPLALRNALRVDHCGAGGLHGFQQSLDDLALPVERFVVPRVVDDISFQYS